VNQNENVNVTPVMTLEQSEQITFETQNMDVGQEDF